MMRDEWCVFRVASNSLVPCKKHQKKNGSKISFVGVLITCRTSLTMGFYQKDQPPLFRKYWESMQLFLDGAKRLVWFSRRWLLCRCHRFSKSPPYQAFVILSVAKDPGRSLNLEKIPGLIYASDPSLCSGEHTLGMGRKLRRYKPRNNQDSYTKSHCQVGPINLHKFA